ncbi:MAG: cell division protein FtsA [Spirochaetes bacterium]|uniref:Cell division protein FtsA n=1 Tax=Candidatus Ornithospirochaeta stercoripullorum TaxID=2840899 RepID=A0A9D9E321_9SPIO|nr:cell division protein FtsA [Candidatus Ornithospirochaeta stercoripullorum]
MAQDKTLVGLDIGTSWTRCVIGTISRDGQLMIESISERPSEGMKSGTIVNIEQTLKVINSVVSDAELQAGTEVSSVILGIGGDHIKGIQSSGVVGIQSRDQEIKREDIRRSIDVARARDLPQDTEILHTLVQDFQVDSRAGIKDPIDMLGHRLDTRVLLVTGSSSICQNLRKCVQKAGLQVQRIVLQTLSDSEVVLGGDEKEMGALVIDIGAGMTNAIAYVGGAPVYAGAIPLGGDNVTGDIAYMLQLPRSAAESIKIADGCCHTPSVRDDEMIVTPAVGGKPSIRLPRKELAKLIEPRMAEIFSMLSAELEKNGVSGTFGAGVVLVGGGALLSGATELAAEIFRMPARIGFPEAINGLDRLYIDPRYSTVLGLLKLEAKKYKEASSMQGSSKEKNGIGAKVKGLFEKLF